VNTPSLARTTGAIPNANPLAIDISAEGIPRSLWCWPPPDLSQGDLWIDYPFSEGLAALTNNARDPELANDIRTRVFRCIDDLIDEGARHSINPFHGQWVFHELLTNATQYGGISSSDEPCLLVRLEWQFHDPQRGGGLSVAVSNPCPHLFDPTRYARMEPSDLYSISGEDNNGHLATIALLGFLKEDTTLSYVWYMPGGSCIQLKVLATQRPQDDQSQTHEGVSQVIHRTVQRFDAEGRAVPYSLEAFESDVASGMVTEKVTVACTVAATQLE
jgi:hypothetical protein